VVNSDPKELKQMRPFDIDAALDHIFADNPDLVKRVQSSPNAINVLVGLGMKIAGGAADPSVIRQKIQDKLQKG
jgi:Asp-tRNA(Asn)/Glu-tRNA(Gln) amidotransferase B subunit